MPATKFICPNSKSIAISECLSFCPFGSRCMAKPTLNAVADSVKDRGLKSFSVTELINGTREMYLKKTCEYHINPQDQIFAMHGSAVHSISENKSGNNILTEIRLSDDITNGQIDAYGDVLGDGKKILLDYKVTSSYKAMQALGFYKVDVPTGEVYKTGAKKGQPKYTKEWRTGGLRHILEWAIQVNYYRVLLEKHNFHVDDMYIQIYVRDYSLRMASERNITKPIYLIKINKISDVWLDRYFKAKRDRLTYAITNELLPNFCSNKETWSGKKCEQYCNVYDECRRLYEASTIADGTQNNTAA